MHAALRNRGFTCHLFREKLTLYLEAQVEKMLLEQKDRLAAVLHVVCTSHFCWSAEEERLLSHNDANYKTPNFTILLYLYTNSSCSSSKKCFLTGCHFIFFFYEKNHYAFNQIQLITAQDNSLQLWFAYLLD